MAFPFRQQIEMVNAIVSAPRLTICVGSGVSRGKLPLLQGLIALAFQNVPLTDEAREAFLVYSRVHAFHLRLTERGIATLDPCTLDHFRLQTREIQAKICEPLVFNYGEVFAALETVAGSKHALLDYLNFQQFDTSDADAAHFYIGFLILEGVVDRLLTTNWDHLVESAVETSISQPVQAALDVIRDEAAWLDRNQGARVALAKIHGCATQYPDHCDNIILTAGELQKATGGGWTREAVNEFLSGTVLFSGYSAADYTVMVPIRVLQSLRADHLLDSSHFFIAQESDLNPAGRDLTNNDPTHHIRLYANDTFVSVYFAYLRRRLSNAIDTAEQQRRHERAFPVWEENVWQELIKRLRALITDDLGAFLDNTMGAPDARHFETASRLPIHISAIRTIFVSGQLQEREKYQKILFDPIKDIVQLVLVAATVDLGRSIGNIGFSLETTHVGITISEASGSKRKILFLHGTYPNTAYPMISEYLNEVENTDGQLPEFEAAVIPCSPYSVPSSAFPTKPILAKTLLGGPRAVRRIVDPAKIFSTKSYDDLVATLRAELEL
jgi:hypothetical protein